MAEKIIAFAGKGGVGKTSLAALTVRLLVEAYPDKKILAIDADPAVGLSTALGVEVKQTVDDIRCKFLAEFTGPNKASAAEAMNDANYSLTDAIEDMGEFAFLAIGRPESAGCYCAVNDFLKMIITEIASSFDYVVIDGEAGIEQINRRVMEKVTDLILVSDASRKGINVITEIKKVSTELNMCSNYGAIINRVCKEDVQNIINLNGINSLGFIDEDKELSMLDVMGESLFSLSNNSVTLRALREALVKMEVVKK